MEGNVRGCEEEDFGIALGTLARAYVAAVGPIVDDGPGGVRGYQVLSSIAAGCPPTQLALAQKLGIDRSVMTYLLDDLEGGGLVVRKPHPSDRRARQLVLTRAGTAALHRMQERMGKAEGQLLHGLTPTEQVTLRDLVLRVVRSVVADGGMEATCTAIAQDIAQAGQRA